MNKKIDKVWLVGLLSYIAYFVKLFTDYDIGSDQIDQIAEAIMLGSAFIPMIKDKFKKPTAQSNYEVYSDEYH